MQPILVLNAGSSSVKFAVYDNGVPLLSREMDRIGLASVFAATDAAALPMLGLDLSVVLASHLDPAQLGKLILLRVARESSYL